MEMWSRKKMKEIGRSRLKANYWKSVLVAAILLILTGAGNVTASSSTSRGSEEETVVTTEMTTESIEEVEEEEPLYPNYAGMVIAGLFVLLVVAIIFAVVIALTVFVINPITVGCHRFFYRNLDKNADVKEVCYPFDRHYKTIVKTMFFRDLYTVLWSLLFIIPGIVKFYEYSMIPYLLAENETMTREEAFAESKRLMKGNKWRAFVLDLSFIPWLLLSGMTFGIVGVLYTCPYIQSTGAAFYQAVKEEDMFRAIVVEEQ